MHNSPQVNPWHLRCTENYLNDPGRNNLSVCIPKHNSLQSREDQKLITKEAEEKIR